MLKDLEEYLRAEWGRRSKFIYLPVLAIWVAYLVISLTTPIHPTPKNSPLHISNQSLYWIKISVALAYLVTWMAAAYSFVKIRRYSNSIKKSREAEGFHFLSIAIAVLVGALIAATLISSVESRITGSGGAKPALIVITNYLYVFPFLVAFGAFWKGSTHLMKGVKPVASSITVAVLGVLLIGFIYLWLNLIFTNPLRNSSGVPGVPATYYLGDSLIVLSIVIPSFVGWALSLGTVINLKNYAQKVEGLIYRKAIAAFTLGVWAVILGSVLLQGLQSLGSIRLEKLGLVKLLLLIYVFLLIQVIGYLYVALGAKRLTKIETV